MSNDRPRSEISPPCGNAVWGCGKRVEWADWMQALWSCKACARAAARKWYLAPSDLGLLLVAYRTAQAGHGEARPSQSEVWAILRQAGVQREIPIPDAPRHAPADHCLPEGDRAAA